MGGWACVFDPMRHIVAPLSDSATILLGPGTPVTPRPGSPAPSIGLSHAHAVHT